MTDLKAALESFETHCDGGDDEACCVAVGDVFHAMAPHAAAPNQGGQPAKAAGPPVDVAGCQQVLGRLGAKARAARAGPQGAGKFNWMAVVTLVISIVQQFLQQQQNP
jgi:hypothetical protein